jgi:hypothetical protein
MARMRGHNQAGSSPALQIKPCIVTNVQGIVKVTTACWSIDFGEGGLGVCSIEQVGSQVNRGEHKPFQLG